MLRWPWASWTTVTAWLPLAALPLTRAVKLLGWLLLTLRALKPAVLLSAENLVLRSLRM